MLRTYLTSISVVVLIALTPALALAAEAATQREIELEKQVEALQTQLKNANQTIADLQDQLGGQAVPDSTASLAGSTATPATAGRVAQTGPDTLVPVPGSSVPTFATGLNYGEDPGGINERQAEIARTPMAITSLGPAEQLLGGIEDSTRLELLVPSLRYGQTGQDVRLAMRGARTASVGAESDPAVAVYEDGIYLATTTEGRNAYFDVQRIDVLRGPQITTFGQHAYAGAVSIVSNKPNFDGISAYAEAENGLPDKTRWRLALNLPASDTLAFRFAGISESRSGWVENNYIEPDSDDMNDRKVQSMRGSMLWQPSEAFSILYLSRYQDENGTGSAPWGYQQVGGYVNGELLPGNQFAGPGAAPDGGPWVVNRNYISSAQYENWLNTLDLNWDMGFAQLQWLSNFTAFHGKQAYDNDYTNLGDPTNTPFSGWETSQTGWSSELRLTSEPGGSFNWLAGIYGSSRSAEWGWLETINGQFEQPSWDTVGDYTTDTVAAFGQATYDFTERFSVTGGLRWNDQKKTYKNGADGQWDDLLWKLALQFDLSDRTMTYFSASTGYRPGGINTAPGVNLDWDPEKLTAYELGLKTQFADDRVRMNLAAFYNDFKDMQSQNFLVMPYPGSPEATEYTGNGGAADATGIEAEIEWRPTSMWNVSTQLTWTDAKFGDYTASNYAGLGDIPGHTDVELLHFDGWRPALTPEWVFGLQTSYTFQLENYGSITPYLQTSYVSDYYANDINLAGIQQGSYSQTDVRVIWLAPRGNFQFQFYYMNAEDEAVLNWARVYNPAARPDITTLQGNWSNPNTYGVIFNYTF